MARRMQGDIEIHDVMQSITLLYVSINVKDYEICFMGAILIGTLFIMACINYNKVKLVWHLHK